MGLNAIVAFQLAPAAGSWQAAMGLVFLDGVLILLLVISGFREAVMHAIPRDLRIATGAGIGIFIALIGFINARIVIPGNPMSHGNLRDPATAVAIIGLLLTAVLMALRVTGALVIGILATTAVGWWFGVTTWPKQMQWLPRFDTVFKLDIIGALKWQLMPLLFSIMMVDFFDTLGTATAIAHQARLHDDRGRIFGIRRVLMVDSISASIGALCGVSSVTSYIESAAGVGEGARTGLHSVLVGALFLLAILLAPIAAIVPPAATAPALILVGFLMIGQMARIDFDDAQIAIPAFLTLLAIPFTYSIAHGIGYGFISFVIIKVAARRFREVHPLMYVVSAAFAVYFWFTSNH
jgi:AGZA family xanthine/uracil permease-like MFS transporter